MAVFFNVFGFIGALIWNSGDKAAAITLSNGDRTAFSNDDNNNGVRSVASWTQGGSRKSYFEIMLDTLSDNADLFLGLANASLGVTADPSSVNFTRVRLNGTFGNGSSVSTTASPTGITSLTAGDIFQCAIDESSGKFYFGKNNTWMNSGDPAAGTGFVATLASSVTVYAGFWTDNSINDTQATLQGTNTYSPPSGFSAVG